MTTTPGGEPDRRTLELIEVEVTRAGAAQERIEAAIDQLGGVLVGFAGVITAILLARGDRTSVLAATATSISAVLGVRVVLMRATSTTVDPVDATQKYIARRPSDVAQALLATNVRLHGERERRLRNKRRWFITAAWALIVGLVVLLVSVTVDVSTSEPEPTPSASVTAGRR